jgi:hypothetical protein
LLLSTQQAATQVLYGSIVGNVTDPSEAAVPDATVTIIETNTGHSRTTTTNTAGAYSFPTVRSGTYEIRVTKSGFQAYTESNLQVTINNVTRVDVALKVGAVTETIVVSASAAMLQTDRSEVRAEMTAKALENVPVPPGRNYQHLFKMLPGFDQPRNAHSVPSNPSRSLQYEVNGAVSASNNVRLDGATQYNVWLPHITAYVPALESIDTVNVVTNSFDAEQGLAGGAAINVQVKSGTNNLHGAVFEYHNDNKLKAKPFFSPPGERNPKDIFNQFGAAVGGPIVRNKLFYFASYEGTIQRQFSSNLYTVPTVLTRQGIMTESDRAVYDPLTGAPDGSGRTPFAGNIIPPSRFEPIVLKLVQLTPQPTFPDRFTQNYFGAGPFPFNRHTLDTKVNWTVNRKLSMYGRYSFLHFDQLVARAFGELGGPPVSRVFNNPGKGFGATHSGTWSVTYLFSPTLILDANVGVTLMDANSAQVELNKNLGLDFLGIPGTNGPREFEGGWPRFPISNYTAIGETEGYMPYFRRDPQHNYQANVNWLKGPHDLRFGMEFSFQHLNHTQPEFAGAGPQAASGGFSFGGGPTVLKDGPAPNQWNSYAAFLLGFPTEIAKIFQFPDEYHTRTGAYSVYVRDRWQINRKLTVSYGTRWEYYPMPTRDNRGLERYIPDTNKVWVCGVGSIAENCGVDVSSRLFAPRLGLAYRATDTFVVRAGYGITIDPWNLARPLRTNHPLLASLYITGPNTFQPAGPLKDGIPTVKAPDISSGVVDIPGNVGVNTLPDEFKRGYIQSWNFTVQKKLGEFTAQAGYVATRQNNIAGYRELNYGLPGGGKPSQRFVQLYGRDSTTRLVGPVGNSHYDSLQLSLERRFRAGYQLQVSYTWSKCISIAGIGNSGDAPAIKIPEFFNLNRSLCSIDTPHNLEIGGIFELPFGRGKRWATGGPGAALLGGWQVNTLFSSYSGNPFTVGTSGASLNAPFNSQRADLVKPNVRKLGGVGPGQAFYDWTAFAPVTEARFGTAGFNILRGPGLVNLDLGLFREFKMTERLHIQFRAEAFNLSNTPHFSNPSSTISNLRLNPDGSFRSGVFEITGTRNAGREGIDERVFRFGLRLAF